MTRQKMLTGILLGALTLGSFAVMAAEAPVKPMGILRGTLTEMSGDQLQVTDRKGAKHEVTVTSKTGFVAVAQGKISDIKPDSFIGTAAAPQPDGTLKALEVHVFDPALRGSGEGFRPWQGADGKVGTMTNGTVGQLVNANGRTMTVKYQNGEKKVVVPDDVPIVTLSPGDKSLLKTGAHVIIFPDAGTTKPVVAGRMIVGVNGTIPPM
ncbi:hypothetical protein SJI19_15560 [Acerihabitans sp. TG2]|uniref:hypothetical protein n=1 Tax=Acerihabitans sp. TG2 TaxID=3096008 RepID=UPI002B22CCEB|nr:hypothetical protein [Acerihabitans sp. TG2]MEA9391944.1 hypothetical protein [Acerihabitans sp. TG2]